MIRKNKVTNSKESEEYWCVAYLIMFNTPRERYSGYKSLKDLLNDGRMQLQKGDYIIRVTKDRRYFLLFKIGHDYLPEKLYPSIEFIPDKPNTKLKYTT